jgi:hypothetical protein
MFYHFEDVRNHRAYGAIALCARAALAEVAQVDHCICQRLKSIMWLAEAIEPEQEATELILPAKHTLNGVEPLLEYRGIEQQLAPAFRQFSASGIQVDVWHHAAVENRLPVTPAIVDAIKAHDRASEIQADGVSDPRHHR